MILENSFCTARQFIRRLVNLRFAKPDLASTYKMILDNSSAGSDTMMQDEGFESWFTSFRNAAMRTHSATTRTSRGFQAENTDWQTRSGIKGRRVHGLRTYPREQSKNRNVAAISIFERGLVVFNSRYNMVSNFPMYCI